MGTELRIGKEILCVLLLGIVSPGTALGLCSDVLCGVGGGGGGGVHVCVCIPVWFCLLQTNLKMPWSQVHKVRNAGCLVQSCYHTQQQCDAKKKQVFMMKKQTKNVLSDLNITATFCFCHQVLRTRFWVSQVGRPRQRWTAATLRL